MKTFFLVVLLGFSAPNWAQSSAFTYQGELEQSGIPATGEFDFEFALFDAELGGTQIAGPFSVEDVFVDGGLFETEIDFGTDVFGGADAWLEIRVREGTSTDTFVVMTPRQKITASPVALHARNVQQGAVDSGQIASGAVTSEKIQDSTVTGADIDVGEVQLRVGSTCAAGSSIRRINSDGTVACETDDDSGRDNVGPSAFLDTTQPFPEGEQTIIPFNAENFDPNNEFDPATHQLTASQSGFYQINTAVSISRASGGGDPVIVCIRLVRPQSGIIANSCGRGGNDFFGTHANLSRLVQMEAGNVLEVHGFVINELSDPDATYEVTGDATGINSSLTVHRVR